MTLGGWIFMGASWLVILALFGYSMVRTLRADKRDGGPDAP